MAVIFICPLFCLLSTVPVLKVHVTCKQVPWLHQHDEKSEKGISPKVLKEKITRKYGYPLFELCHQYHNMQDWLLKSVIFSHSGLLTRRMLIFPSIEGHTHWIVTFVFNPSFIDEQDGETNSGKMLWPCFLVL